MASLQKVHDLTVAITEEARDIDRSAVAEPDPDDLRLCSVKHTQAVKVFILGHEDESVRGSVRPDCPVAGRGQSNLAHVN